MLTTEYIEMPVYITNFCLSVLVETLVMWDVYLMCYWSLGFGLIILKVLFFSFFCRVRVCQSPSDGEGCCKSDWRRPQMQQLPVYQWEVCHYTEHRSKFAPFKKTDAANLLKSLTIIWLYRCKCIKKECCWWGCSITIRKKSFNFTWITNKSLEASSRIKHTLHDRDAFYDLLMSALPLAQNPAIAEIYTEHAHQVTVAKYSPSGFYIASGGEQPKQTSTEDFPVCHLPSCPHYVLLLIKIYIL